jgi:predicted RNase H-like nuclease (RuvC/YqgF family)
VFCYAGATVSLHNAHTQKTLKPKIDEAKGGWTDRSYAKACEEAFDELAKKIAEKVAPMMRN